MGRHGRKVVILHPLLFLSDYLNHPLDQVLRFFKESTSYFQQYKDNIIANHSLVAALVVTINLCMVKF